MRVRVDRSSASPASEQVARAIRERIERNVLRPGDRLPTVRGLAADLGVATNTVAKAYRFLEAEGLLVGRGRYGTFVAVDASPSRSTRARLLGEAASEYLRTARALGASGPEAVAAVRSRATRR
jgi:DNA-binding transcriptional regulator YhcF (GntR family)